MLLQRTGVSPTTIQQEEVVGESLESARRKPTWNNGLEEDWTRVAFRPDLYSSPELKAPRQRDQAVGLPTQLQRAKAEDAATPQAAEQMRAESADASRMTGARTLDKFDWDGAECAYDAIRAQDDVVVVAQNTGWPKHQIQRIKDHLFDKKHILDDGLRQFDADPQIANAWMRLQSGQHTAADIQLLQHELFESKFEGIFRTDYRTAHEAANRSGRPSGLE